MILKVNMPLTENGSDVLTIRNLNNQQVNFILGVLNSIRDKGYIEKVEEMENFNNTICIANIDYNANDKADVLLRYWSGENE